MKQWQIIATAVAASLLASVALVVGHDRNPSTASRPAGTATGHTTGSPPPAGAVPPPWQVDVQADGSSLALGLRLSHEPGQASTLAQVRQRFGPDTQIAIIAAPGEDGTLEAFVDPAQAGFIAGKLVITAELPAATLRGMRERAVKAEFMESTTRKYVLRREDEAQALQARVVALNFIPQAALDADVITARFGQPAQRVRSNGHLEHFLYPQRGLDVVLDTEGKELLQYVAPRHFERLSAPLAASGASAASR